MNGRLIKPGGAWARNNCSEFLLIITFLFFLPTALKADSRAGAEKRVIVYLLLEGEPAARAYLDAAQKKAGANAAAAAAQQKGIVENQQTHVLEQINKVGGKELGRMTRLVNAIRVAVPSSRIGHVKSLPGVVKMVPARKYKPLTGSSVPFVGATKAWSLPNGGLTGKGMRIGVIDTGIDYLHAHFRGNGIAASYSANDRTIIEPGTFPTAKVVGGFDFAGDAYDADSDSTSNPQPDPDPLDCDGHGTHVAGIAAGVGVLSSGLPYSGTYTNLNPAALAIGPGVAPDASLYALKVFGCNGSTLLVLEALEWAADPNQDNDYSDRLDVLNLSLGSDYGFGGAGDPELDAVNMLAELGCVPVIAAGNSGDIFYVMSAPAVAERCITVANSLDDGLNLEAIQVTSPAVIAGNYAAVQGAFTVPLKNSGPVQAPLVYASPVDACLPLQNASQISGKVALLDRGTCFFVNKVKQAQDAGAVAVIVVNNVSEDPFEMVGTPSYTVTIPGVMISQADGQILKNYLNSGVEVRLAAGQATVRADRLSTSSSRGPGAPGNLLKPDISAPGSSISSARFSSGTGAMLLSGTSMAAPHVAGAAVLLKQQNPDWSTEQIKAALMNTARPMRDGSGVAYPPTRSGAGCLQLGKALETSVTARAAATNGGVGLSLGAMEFTAPKEFTRTILLTNHSVSDVSYTVAISNSVTEAGFEVRPGIAQVKVPAKSEVQYEVTFSATPALFDRTLDGTSFSQVAGLKRTPLYEVGGEIWFLNPTQPIQLIWAGSVRAASQSASSVTNLTLSGSTEDFVTIPLHDPAQLAGSLVSVFQLGEISTNRGYLDASKAMGDLMAVGAASDAFQRGGVNEAMLYFGVAAYGNWTAPMADFVEFVIEIDLNQDGSPDYEIFNDYLPVAQFLNGSDFFGSFGQVAGATSGESNAWLNVFPQSAWDTALFNNSVMVLPAKASLLGLEAGAAVIDYRVMTYGPAQHGKLQLDATEWIRFDAESPVLDATGMGLSGTPFHGGGAPVQVRVNWQAAAQQRLADRASLLLLYPFNENGARHQIVEVGLSEVPVLQPVLQDQDGVSTLRWSSHTGKRYAVEAADDLRGPFGVLASGLAATPPINQFVDPAPNKNARFYRIKVVP